MSHITQRTTPARRLGTETGQDSHSLLMRALSSAELAVSFLRKQYRRFAEDENNRTDHRFGCMHVSYM